ncbi:MAG: hypothetical protein ACK47B_25660 [Armatimonadota bacterium]
MSQVQLQSNEKVDRYLESLRLHLMDVPAEERQWLLQQGRARIELALELEGAGMVDEADVERVLAKLDDPATLAQRLRAQAPPSPQATPAGRTAPCRSCRREVSTEALSCPQCGAPWPARQAWRGWGYEWKSETTVLGVPLVHVAFGRDENGKLRVAKGIVAIGQFGIGAITIAQFGVGAVFGLGQFVLAPLAIGQFAFGLAAAGQFGIGLLYGAGQIATGALKAWGMIKLGG